MATKKHVEEKQETSIHGDILESIFTHVPLIDLVSALLVSKSWKLAVSTSLRHFNKVKPWLLLHSQSISPPYSIALHAYDPRSHVWIRIHNPPLNHFSTLRSSHSNLLYMISPSKFSFSFDPMHLTWHHVDAPLFWRSDPIVAVVGHRIVIAGGTCDFEDDPLSVEMYDLKTHSWNSCDSMPAMFKDSAASTWLSIAVDGNRMYVMEKSTSVTYWFIPETKSWYGPYNLRPDSNVCSSSIGFANDRLILIGQIGDDEGALISLKLWEINSKALELCREIGEMPKQLVEKLIGWNFHMSATVVNVMDHFLYISNTSNPEDVLLCELRDGACIWSSIKNVVANERERPVFTCANVGLGDLHRAIVAEGRQFLVLAREEQRL